MNTTISRDEWLQALGAAAQPCDPDALTAQEIAQQFGVSTMTAWRRVNKLIAEGRAVATVKEIATRDGHTKRVPAYKLVKPHKAKR